MLICLASCQKASRPIPSKSLWLFIAFQGALCRRDQEAKPTPERLKNKHWESKNMSLFIFCQNCCVLFCSSTPRDRKKLTKKLPGASRNHPGKPEIDQLFASGGARGSPSEFWKPAPWAHWECSWRPLWEPTAPKSALQAQPRPSLDAPGNMFHQLSIILDFCALVDVPEGTVLSKERQRASTEMPRQALPDNAPFPRVTGERGS